MSRASVRSSLLGSMRSSPLRTEMPSMYALKGDAKCAYVSFTYDRAIGDVIERLDILIALRKASEAIPPGSLYGAVIPQIYR